MKLTERLKTFTKFEMILWSVSSAVITVSFAASPDKDWLTLISSLIGVTSLILIAKGDVLGQFIMIAFGIMYGIVSYFFRYYGEMITYLCMTLPAAVVSAISWLKHPYRKSEVKTAKLNGTKISILFGITAVLTAVFYFVLRALKTANLAFSTVSVATSLLASILTIMRSPLYALAYAANDLVLITLWTLAATQNTAYIPMILCFTMFFINDVYGYVNWRKMANRQDSESGEK